MSTLPSLESLAALAIEAGREIMAVRAEGFEAMTKGDGSVVTIADQRAEDIIERGLAALAPGIPMLGEEATAAGRIPDTSGRFFCVDPLDGTRGFSRGGTEFTVNIGLVEDGVTQMGVVLSPIDGALYAGEPGRALRARVTLDADASIAFEPISVSGKQGDMWRLVASRSFGRTHEALAFAAALGTCLQDDASSSIKFCRVAEGAADLYPRFGQMREWDAAAAHAILNAAGGGVMLLDGSPLTYGRRDVEFLIDGLIAYSNETAAAAARDALAQMRA